MDASEKKDPWGVFEFVCGSGGEMFFLWVLVGLKSVLLAFL